MTLFFLCRPVLPRFSSMNLYCFRKMELLNSRTCLTCEHDFSSLIHNKSSNIKKSCENFSGPLFSHPLDSTNVYILLFIEVS